MKKRIFNHITAERVWKLTLDTVMIGLTSLAVIGLVGIISTIIMDPSVIDNASFGIYR
jgi:hypothetical protein